MRFAVDGAQLFLAARDAFEVERAAADVSILLQQVNGRASRKHCCAPTGDGVDSWCPWATFLYDEEDVSGESESGSAVAIGS
jgi:hypothetical protein